MHTHHGSFSFSDGFEGDMTALVIPDTPGSADPLLIPQGAVLSLTVSDKVADLFMQGEGVDLSVELGKIPGGILTIEPNGDRTHTFPVDWTFPWKDIDDFSEATRLANEEYLTGGYRGPGENAVSTGGVLNGLSPKVNNALWKYQEAQGLRISLSAEDHIHFRKS